jgi:hypothetical protein
MIGIASPVKRKKAEIQKRTIQPGKPRHRKIMPSTAKAAVIVRPNILNSLNVFLVFSMLI